MMCYRDRTYCAGPCENDECSRQVTDLVTDAAERAGLPLAIMDLRAGCRNYLPPSPARRTPSVPIRIVVGEP